jgi:hypothetical protein
VSTTNFSVNSNKRLAPTKIVWAIYLAAIGVATIGWLGLLSYCALALLGY